METVTSNPDFISTPDKKIKPITIKKTKKKKKAK